MNWVRVRPQTRKAYKKYLQYHQLEKSVILYQEAGIVWGPASRFRPTKEKMSCFGEDFASLGDSSPPPDLSVAFWAPHFYKALMLPGAYPRQA